MSNDGGGALSLGGTPKREEPKPSRATDATPLFDRKFVVDSNADAALFCAAMVVKVAADVTVAAGACVSMAGSAAVAPETAGASVAAAYALMSIFVECCVGIVSDVITIVEGFSEYNKDGSMSVGLFKPSSPAEAIVFFISGPIKIEG